MISKQEQDIAKIIPEEIHISIDHDSQKLWQPDYEEVNWYKSDEDEDGEPIKKHLQYSRKYKNITNACPMPSDEMWKTFLQRLEEIDVYSWETKDIPVVENVTDISPEIWEIKIVSQGGNIFEASGPIEELPPRFDEFCEAVSELIGQPFGKD